MRVEKSEENLTIFLMGDIDAQNATSVQREIEETLKAQGDSNLIFDARELAYISSAGLRVLLTIQKNQTGKISVINISDDVLDIFRMAGFQHFMDLKGV